MTKMADTESNENKPLEDFELSSELSTILANNLLPSRIVNKIGEKLEEKKIKITKKQLYNLVEKLRVTMRTFTKFDQPESKTKETPTAEIQKETKKIETPLKTEGADMKKLVDTIEQLKDRITIIEQNRLEGIKGSSNKPVTTKDIKTIEKIDVPVREEEMSPLLQIPNDPESVVVLMKWLQYLVDKIGKTHLPDALGYYVDIGWISDDVRLDLMKYSNGITEETSGIGTRKESSNLPAKDHLQSLLYIQKLKGLQFDERFVFRIDREMQKMAKSLEGYQVK
jgi:flagellar protein FlaD